MSKSKGNEGQSLAVAFAKELAELTGESPSRLHQWWRDLGLPGLRARQTFYTYLQRDGWERESAEATAGQCRLGSNPMSCQLRLRVVSFVTQFRRDIQAGKKRQLIVLLGYEVCSHLIHFQLYRGEDVEVRKHEEIHGIGKCEVLPVVTVAAFVKECARMVGLPLRQVLLTQNLMDFQPQRGKESFLSLTQGKVMSRERGSEIDDNEVLCSVGSEHRYRTLEGNHPFIDWCGTTNATKLTADLSVLVKAHNETPLKRLGIAQHVLDAKLKKTDDVVKARQEVNWRKMKIPPSSEMLLKKYEYVSERYSLRKVKLYSRKYENFLEYPGDQRRVIK